MITLMKNYKAFIDKCPHGPSILLIMIYLNDNGLPSRKEDLSKGCSKQLVEDIISYLQKNDVISPVIYNEEIHYVVNRISDILPLKLSPAEKFDILSSLRKVFPSADKFNTEVAYLEGMIRKHKLLEYKQIIMVLDGLQGSGLKTLEKVSRKDIDIILSSAEKPEAKSDISPTATEQKLARMMYSQMTDKRLKERLLRSGVQIKHIQEQLEQIGESFRLDAVIAELKGMPVKFKFLE